MHEHIDPFSGILTLAHTDLHLPGNGGLDLKLIRTYNSMIWGRRDLAQRVNTAYPWDSPLQISTYASGTFTIETQTTTLTTLNLTAAAPSQTAVRAFAGHSSACSADYPPQR